MIAKELQLDGQHTDLTDTVAVTVKGPDIAEMRSGAAYSNTFKLPYTRKNSVATGNAGNLNVTPSGSGVPASLTIGGIDALSGSGQAFVRGSDRDGYSVDVKGGAYNFFDLLKNTQLVDLPGWDAYDFTYSNTDIIARTDINDDIVFAVIDYGRSQGANYTVIDGSGTVYSYPSMRLQFLISFMCNALGYELVQEPAGLLWQRLALPFNKGIFQNGPRYINANTLQSTGTSGTWTGTLQPTTGTPTYFYTQVPGGGITSLMTDQYTISAFIEQIASTLTIGGGTTYANLRLDLYQGANFPGSGAPLTSVAIASAPFGNAATNIDLAYFTQLPVTTILRTFLVIECGGVGVVSWSVSWDSSALKAIPRAIIDLNGYRFTPEALLPSASCAEMMRAALVQMGAFITVDEQAKEVSILTADQLAGLEGFASDWGRKFADTLPVPTATDYQGFEATNFLRFTKDGDVTEGRGDGSFNVTTGDQKSKTYLQSLFSPSSSANILNLNLFASRVIHWQRSSDGTSWQEYTTDTIRLVLLCEVAISKNYLVFATTTTKTTPVVGVFEDYYAQGNGDATLDYAANNVYQTVARWANEGRRFTAKFLLSLNDIQSMHLMQSIAGYNLCGILRPVHVPQLGATCLIESISQWVDEETPCEVTLLKIG